MSSRSKIPLLEWLALLAIVALGFFLRTRDIGAFRLSPDDGNYLHSARVQELERDASLGEMLAQDVEWVKWIARGDWRGGELYPHSYLHQLAARWLYRFGLSSVAAVRTSSAIFGALTAAALYAFAAWSMPERRRVGLFAALLLAVMPVHVWYSRTGWGVMGCTFFHVLYVAIAWELFANASPSDGRKVARLGVGLALTSVLAWGYHEMIAPFVVSMAVCFFGARIFGAQLGRAKLTAFVASAAPVGLFTIGVYFFSDFAQAHWFEADRAATYAEMRWESALSLLVNYRIDVLLTYPVIAFALLGAWSLYKEERALACFLAANLGLGALLLFFLYQDPFLVRIYFPLAIFGVLFAAVGVASLRRFLPSLAVIGVGASVALYLGLQTWFSLFGPLDHPFFNRYLYVVARGELREPRHVDEHLIAKLRVLLGAHERVTAYADKGPLYRLFDAGIPASVTDLKGPRESLPTWVFAPVTVMQREKRTTETGGEYRLVGEDLAGRIGLFRFAK
ncbi:MAG: hypothetical protein ACKVWV_04190 [Planctomycetota bacterium]